MKNKFSVIEFLVLIAGLTIGSLAQAQTNAPAPPASAQSFFNSAEGYFTSFNTNYNWSGTALEISVAADYQSGVQWANDLEAQYDLEAVTSQSFLENVDLGYRMRNAGIAGVIQMNEAELGYNLVSYYDTRVEVSLGAGYDDEYDCAVFEPELDLLKKLTPNTFAGLYISEPILTRQIPANRNQWVPNIGVKTGFTYGGVSATGASLSLRVSGDHFVTALRRDLDRI